MKMPQRKFITTGLNGLSLTAGIITAGVIFGSISCWWLLLSIPLTVIGTGYELQEIQV